tara:strand:+ start:7105 stop:7644 length:540 start_codon:yes stop_codon:yes gene_type:complete
MKLKIKGKKSGVVGSAISNFWSYVLFVFVVIIFIIFFQIQKHDIQEVNIKSLDDQVNMDMSAINHLRTPIEFEIDADTLLITEHKTLADFLAEQIGLSYSGLVDFTELQEEIDETIKANIRGYRRIMIFTEDELGCFYDSRGMNCLYRQPLVLQIAEGVAILPLIVEGDDFALVKVVFQ